MYIYTFLYIYLLTMISANFCSIKRLSIWIHEWLGKIQWSIIKEKDFYCHLNMEDIAAADYTNSKEFEKSFLVEYHDLYLQSKTLLLANVFEKFRNICLEI